MLKWQPLSFVREAIAPAPANPLWLARCKIACA